MKMDTNDDHQKQKSQQDGNQQKGTETRTSHFNDKKKQNLSEEKDKLRSNIVEQLLEIYYLKHEGPMCEFLTWPAKDRIHKFISSRCQDDDIIKDTNFSHLLNLSFDEPPQEADNNKLSESAPTATTSINTTSLIPQTLSPQNDSISPPPEKKICRESPVKQKNDSVEVSVTPTPNKAIVNDKTNGLQVPDVEMVDVESVISSMPQIPPKDAQTAEIISKSDSSTVENKVLPSGSALNDSTNKDISRTGSVSFSESKSSERPRAPEESPTRISKVVDRIVTPAANANNSQEQTFERAKHEAAILSRIAELRKQGMWPSKRMPKLLEPPRPKTHWDYLLEEMKWLSTDFDAERRWKRKAAKKCALMVYRYHQEKRSKIERAERERLQNIKKVAANQAREIRNFWSQIEELVDFRQTTKLEETRKKAWGLHLNYMLDQTSKMTTSLEDSTNNSVCLETNTTKDKDMEIDYLISQEGEKDEKEPVIKSEEQTEQQSKQDVEDIAAGAQSIQPKGNTLETTTVSTKVPFLLKHSLREYQHIGLDWLVAMYNKKLNGILADEMGLGKTIQTIALLAHLACEKGDWGPHLIVVPTSVMLNWEMEIKKWCPAFKILTYYGNPKERKMKRVGWSRPNSFHICITSYRIVIQDHAAFRRKKWTYFILDEAHYIKNFKSQRWQMLLNFNSQRRLLLTGTPLQNDLMELWSLMHFLMPKFFDSCREFKDWFVNPLAGMIEGNQEYNEQLVARLHKVLRPFLLRRLKNDVEKQLPRKREFIKTCRLSKRQRFLYEEFMSLSKTKETLASGNFLSVINVLMQLRKVCNHPNLFEPRPTVSPYMMKSIAYRVPGLVTTPVDYDPHKHVNLESLRLLLVKNGEELTSSAAKYIETRVVEHPRFVEEIPVDDSSEYGSVAQSETSTIDEVDPSQELVKSDKIEKAYAHVKELRKEQKKCRLDFMSQLNDTRCKKIYSPYYMDLHDHLDMSQLAHIIDCDHDINNFANGNARILCSSVNRFRQNPRLRLEFLTKCIDEAIKNPEQLVERMSDIIDRFVFCVPGVSAPRISLHVSHPKPSKKTQEAFLQQTFYEQLSPGFGFLNKIIINMKTSFPELRLIEYDCGKLQTLGRLLTELKSQDHRVLIFTQMSRMLDILEQFLNYHGHTYLRLDGATKIDQRQILMERFNNDRKIFCFILSTRSGGIGVNLTGADTVIFYDSDWNPTMDAQAQDRCHRIGQTKDVHIYRLISEDTIEKNIFMKAQQKKMLGDLAIEDGNFNTSSGLKRNAIQDLFNVQKSTETFELDKVTEVTMTKAEQQKLELALSKGEAEAGECMDVDAIELARDDGDTDLREFDESIPITEENSPIVEKSEKEQEIDQAVAQMTPIQQYAVRYLESLQKPKNKEELEQAEMELRLELENKKSQWEQSRIELLKEQAMQNESNETVLTYPRGAKCERVHYMLDGEKEQVEEMPLWAPPTPPTSPPSPVEETSNSQQHHHYHQPSMTPAMAARINAMGGLADIFGFGSESSTKDVKSFIDEKDLYVDFSQHFLYEPSVMLESQLPPVNQDYTENEPTSYTIGSKKIRITGTPVVPSGYFQSSQSGSTNMPHLQHHLQNLTNIPTSMTPDGMLGGNTIQVGQQVARKPKVRRDEVICLPKSIFDRQTPNFAKIRRELKLQKLRCVTKGNDSDPFAMQKFFHSFSLNPLGQSLQQDSIVTQVNKQIQQFNDSRILMAYHQDQLPPWTIQEEWALLMVIQHLQDVPVNLCILTPGHTPNWELTSEVVSEIGFTYRSFKMCEYHFAYTIQKREMTLDSSWDERAVQSFSQSQPQPPQQPPPPKKSKKNKTQSSSATSGHGNSHTNNSDSQHLGMTAGSDASQSSSKSSSLVALGSSTGGSHGSGSSTIPFRPSKTGALLAGDRSLQLSFRERYEIIARIRQNRPRISVKQRFLMNGRPVPRQHQSQQQQQPQQSQQQPQPSPMASSQQQHVPPATSPFLCDYRCLKPEAVIAEALEHRKRQVYARTMDPRYAPANIGTG